MTLNYSLVRFANASANECPTSRSPGRDLSQHCSNQPLEVEIQKNNSTKLEADLDSSQDLFAQTQQQEPQIPTDTLLLFTNGESEHKENEPPQKKTRGKKKAVARELDLSRLESNSNDMYSRIKRRAAQRKSLPLETTSQPCVDFSKGNARRKKRHCSSSPSVAPFALKFPPTPSSCRVQQDFALPHTDFALPHADFTLPHTDFTLTQASHGFSSSLPLASVCFDDNSDILFETPQRPRKRGRRSCASQPQTRRRSRRIFDSRFSKEVTSPQPIKSIQQCSPELLFNNSKEKENRSSPQLVDEVNRNETRDNTDQSNQTITADVDLSRQSAVFPVSPTNNRSLHSTLPQVSILEVSNFTLRTALDNNNITDASDCPLLSESLLLAQVTNHVDVTLNKTIQSLNKIYQVC